MYNEYYLAQCFSDPLLYNVSFSTQSDFVFLNTALFKEGLFFF